MSENVSNGLLSFSLGILTLKISLCSGQVTPINNQLLNATEENLKLTSTNQLDFFSKKVTYFLIIE